MHLMYFSELPMSAYPEDKARETRLPGPRGESVAVTALLFSNQYYDSVEGSRLYNERLEEYDFVEKMGYDGIMFNEHHTAPFCMSPRINIIVSMVAARTERVKLVLLGNPIPIWDSPVHLAEETAIIDMVSKGRLVPGIVRGGGIENIQANMNPFHNRERFYEGHDLMVKAWTEPGPFRWEGKHYQFRVVNPWATPLQKPHPRIWVPGISSPETVIWAADHRYPYIGLGTNFEQTAMIRNIYTERAEEIGYEAGSEQFGLLLQCHVASSAEKADRNVKEFMWMAGEFTGLSYPVWTSPSGYGSPKQRNALIQLAGGRRDRARPAPLVQLTQRRNERTFVWGTPDQVVEQLKIVLDNNPVGIMALWGNDGRISHEDSMDCIRLTGEYVIPEIREYARQKGIVSPFEADTPVSLAYTPKEQLHPKEPAPSRSA